MGSEYCVTHSINICVWHTEIAKIGLHISAGCVVSHNLTLHFFTRLVEFLWICFDFLTENETTEAPISLLHVFNIRGCKRSVATAFDPVSAHFGRVIELNTKELGEGGVVVRDSFGSVVGKDLFTVQTVTQWLAVC